MSDKTHIHVHFHVPQQQPTNEIHWHLYADLPEAQQVKAPAKEGGSVLTFGVVIDRPSAGEHWNVRPPTSGSNGAGLICAWGTASVGSEPAEEVWAYIFDHEPDDAEGGELDEPHADAVCGEILDTQGHWRFHHDSSSCVGSPTVQGQRGTEIPNARHSSSGVDNWLVVWGKVGDDYEAEVKKFIGLTSTTTSCGGAHGFIAAPESSAVPPPLPRVIKLRVKLPEGKKSIQLEYSPAASQGMRPVWQSACGKWRLAVESVSNNWVATLDGRWPGKNEELHVRWGGVVDPESERARLSPVAPEELVRKLGKVELRRAHE